MNYDKSTLVRIDINIHKALKVAAAAEGLSVCQLVSKVMTDYLHNTAGAPYLKQ
ncbi:toxin-antitoxin system HicB family antitoxin [Dehalococcoides mccartyi]|uniref:Uncharacterized protein n=1 Tax=Dehalococcoides mccartyi (strain CBDB1) TaxID=255470 RepID=A0A916KMB6_DEHMC|nr:toxin-antitoxin system HicB family antitoxin [Dehalococcoides mccartyi]CAI82856.1 hypothetical protein cbdbA693 [Dehalococcoides mccartyi CBDB1]